MFIALALDRASIKPTLAPGNLLQAGYLESLAVFDNVNKLCCL